MHSPVMLNEKTRMRRTQHFFLNANAIQMTKRERERDEKSLRSTIGQKGLDLPPLGLEF